MFSNGNRAIGQEELRLLRLEANQPIFPEDFADTISGSMALREDEKNLMAAYLRRPKSKRVNYTLNRIDSPMYPALAKVAEQEWRRVTEDKDSTRPMKRPRSERSAEDVKEDLVRDADIEIIRSQRELRTCLGNAFLSCCPTLRRRGSGRPQKMVAQLPDSLSENTMVLNSKRFTRVVLYAPGKGSPMKNAIICEADPSDLIAMREKNGNAYTGFRESKAKRGDSAPARDVIGYVTIGGFSLTRGSGIGNGVVSVNSLRRLVGKGAVIPNGRRKGVETGGIIVLFRNVSSLHYRPALIRVVP
ncbi:unnamed protein product [Chondrus crispus]|uniref:Uncharacterized protein n=1 Tax=Chondrus crispus TaxID=2769 RepID=R7QGV5_CHOCR|nr:unnamed protein product [Chondrus crispus]CDF36650.1 unnamed protein product [Chondrus crispus]|eukprot:XP_005716469.1 unnamed protein product [Chondrus crispus]